MTESGTAAATRSALETSVDENWPPRKRGDKESQGGYPKNAYA